MSAWKSLNVQHWNGGANRNSEFLYLGHTELDARTRVRLVLHRDSYDSQSYARAEVFSPVDRGWHYLAELYDQAQILKLSYTCDDQTWIAAVNADAAALLAKAEKILGGRRSA